MDIFSASFDFQGYSVGGKENSRAHRLGLRWGGEKSLNHLLHQGYLTLNFHDYALCRRTLSHSRGGKCVKMLDGKIAFTLYFSTRLSLFLFSEFSRRKKAFASPQQREVLVRRCQMCRAAFWWAGKDVESVCNFTTQCAWPSDDFTP